MSVFALIAFTLTARTADPFVTELIASFACEQNGHNPAGPCDRSGYLKFRFTGVSSTAFALIGLFPMVTLTYVLSVKELKEICGKWSICQRKYSAENSKNTTSTTNA